MKGEWEMVWNKKKRMIESFNEKILARTRMCYLNALLERFKSLKNE